MAIHYGSPMGAEFGPYCGGPPFGSRPGLSPDEHERELMALGERLQVGVTNLEQTQSQDEVEDHIPPLELAPITVAASVILPADVPLTLSVAPLVATLRPAKNRRRVVEESAEDAAVRMARKTVACGIVTPSIHDPPVKSDDCLMREVAGGVYKWKCPICDGSYSRSRTIITHFPRCVVKNGNPMGLRWDDTPLLSTVGIRH